MQQHSFLALGDSYTIGEAVAETERWPYVLTQRLQQQGLFFNRLDYVATTGWTTNELQDGIAARIADNSLLTEYSYVSLLIGVNNQYRGWPITQYGQQFEELLETALSFCGGDPNRVLVLSIPHWGLTPFAEAKDRAQLVTEIDEFNTVNRHIAHNYQVLYVDIAPLSRQVATNPALTAADGLHPSATHYALWVDEVVKVF